MDSAFEAFHQLVTLCQERGYDPEGATFDKQLKYRGMPNYPQYDTRNLPWCFSWNEMYDYEEHGPQSRKDRPAILWLSGREEWHQQGELHREDGPAVITSKGTPKFFLRGRKAKMMPAVLPINQ